jgi:hypothetical protein
MKTLCILIVIVFFCFIKSRKKETYNLRFDYSPDNAIIPDYLSWDQKIQDATCKTSEIDLYDPPNVYQIQLPTSSPGVLTTVYTCGLDRELGGFPRGTGPNKYNFNVYQKKGTKIPFENVTIEPRKNKGKSCKDQPLIFNKYNSLPINKNVDCGDNFYCYFSSPDITSSNMFGKVSTGTHLGGLCKKPSQTSIDANSNSPLLFEDSNFPSKLVNDTNKINKPIQNSIVEILNNPSILKQSVMDYDTHVSICGYCTRPYCDMATDNSFRLSSYPNRCPGLVCPGGMATKNCECSCTIPPNGYQIEIPNEYKDTITQNLNVWGDYPLGYNQGFCKPGYYDKTKGSSTKSDLDYATNDKCKTWPLPLECLGTKCIGGSYVDDEGNCACIPKDKSPETIIKPTVDRMIYKGVFPPQGYSQGQCEFGYYNRYKEWSHVGDGSILPKGYCSLFGQSNSKYCCGINCVGGKLVKTTNDPIEIYKTTSCNCSCIPNNQSPDSPDISAPGFIPQKMPPPPEGYSRGTCPSNYYDKTKGNRTYNVPLDTQDLIGYNSYSYYTVQSTGGTIISDFCRNNSNDKNCIFGLCPSKLGYFINNDINSSPYCACLQNYISPSSNIPAPPII